MSLNIGEGQENKGFFDNMKGQMGGMADKILGLPDRPKSSAARRAARIGFSILVIGLGVGLFFVLNRGGFSALANPSLMTLMSMPMTVGITGVGIAWLMEDVVGIFGHKAQRGVAKVLAAAMPILLAGGAIALMAAGFHGGLTGTAVNGWFFAGLLLLPLAGYAAYKGANVITNKQANIFIGRQPPEKSHRNDSRWGRKNNQRRIDRAFRRRSVFMSEESLRQTNRSRHAGSQEPFLTHRNEEELFGEL